MLPDPRWHSRSMLLSTVGRQWPPAPGRDEGRPVERGAGSFVTTQLQARRSGQGQRMAQDRTPPARSWPPRRRCRWLTGRPGQCEQSPLAGHERTPEALGPLADRRTQWHSRHPRHRQSLLRDPMLPLQPTLGGALSSHPAFVAAGELVHIDEGGSPISMSFPTRQYTSSGLSTKPGQAHFDRLFDMGESTRREQATFAYPEGLRAIAHRPILAPTPRVVVSGAFVRAVVVPRSFACPRRIRSREGSVDHQPAQRAARPPADRCQRGESENWGGGFATIRRSGCGSVAGPGVRAFSRQRRCGTDRPSCGRTWRIVAEVRVSMAGEAFAC